MSVLGTNANQVSVNGNLGRMAFQNPDSIVLEPQATATPYSKNTMVFELTNDTTLTIKVKGSDGVVRSATLTLA